MQRLDFPNTFFMDINEAMIEGLCAVSQLYFTDKCTLIFAEIKAFLDNDDLR